MSSPSIEQVLALLQICLRKKYGKLGKYVILDVGEPRELCLPFPVEDADPSAAETLPDAPAFTPNAYQREILELLDGRALKADALAAKLGGDRRRLFRAGGLSDLRDRNLVINDSQFGYYRPDRPPEEISEAN